MCSDPLAFQWLSNHTSRHRNAIFVDVDFPELMTKKREIIVSTPQLRDLLGPYQALDDSSGIHIRSKHYLALGCDLTDLSKLDTLLANEICLSQSLILCTAEVSMTYMNVEAADSLIQWTAHMDDGMSEGVQQVYFCADSFQYAFVYLNSTYPMAPSIHLHKKCSSTSTTLIRL